MMLLMGSPMSIVSGVRLGGLGDAILIPQHYQVSELDLSWKVQYRWANKEPHVSNNIHSKGAFK